MDSIKVALGDRSYDIVIRPGLLRDAAALLAPYARANRLIVVTDENAGQHVAPALVASLSGAGIRTDMITLPAGESTKSWTHLAQLCDQLLALEVERKDHIIALGGGVIGDLVGFAAAIIKRGCQFIQIPTTLLSQVDSSVGGKTAINTGAGKNLIGSFHQPSLVLIDPETLSTLQLRQIRAGYAEVVKYGLINDPDFFAWCEAHGPALLAGDLDARTHAIRTSVAAKAAVVAADERETLNIRALLNLGHTFGHALEAERGFSDALLHGEGVAAGMALAFVFSAERGLCAAADAERVAAHLAATGLPYGLQGFNTPGAHLVAHMLHDKKRSGGTLPFILARGIGQSFVDSSVALDDVAAFLDRLPR